MTREQILKHQDRLDKMDALSERILNVVCVGAGDLFLWPDVRISWSLT